MKFLGAAVGVLLAFAPSAAYGASWRVPQAPLAGPRFLGNNVAWVASRGDHGGDLIETRKGVAHRVQAFPPGPNPIGGRQPFLLFELAGSSTHVILASHRHCAEENPAGASCDAFNVFAGRSGSSLTNAQHCENFVPGTLSGVDISRTVAVFPRCDRKLIVRDLSGDKPDLILGTEAHLGRIAGRYVAWLEGAYAPSISGENSASIIVFDRIAQQVAYTIPKEAIPGQVSSLALARDGKVAVAFDPTPNDTRVQAEVAWASPQHPQLRRVGLPVRASYTLKIAKNRIAFLRIKHDVDASAEEAGVATLAGKTQLITRHAALSSDIDFDGRSVAYVTKARGRTDVRTRRVQ